MDVETSQEKEVKDLESHGARTETPDTTASSETDSQRAETPGPMPKYCYSKDDLVKISTSPAARKRPFYLARDFDTAEGFWDPERWVRSFDTSRGSSPTNYPTNRDRKRSLTEIDRDAYKRRPSADPKARLKEEDEDQGIVLSPQRGSFLTGCHVIKQTAPRRPNSPADQDRDGRDRRGDTRRIGSGRIQIDRDRERDRGDYREPRSRFDGDDRSSFGRDRLERGDRTFRRDDDRHTRSFGERRYGRMHRREEEDTPEWFTGGPTSQNETIELHGFEREKNSEEDEEVEEAEEEEEEEQAVPEEHLPNASQQIAVPVTHEGREEGGKKVIISRKPEPRRPSSRNANVVDRNGSLETNESSSPEASPPSDHGTPTPPAGVLGQDFDFNEFFKINIPGLHDNLISEPDAPATGSRFSQWFNLKAGAHEGRSDSRRSSITEDFTFLAGQLESLVSGQKSPRILSPPLDQQHRLFSPITTPEQKQHQNLLEMLHHAKINVQPLQDTDPMHHLHQYPVHPNNNLAMPPSGLLASDVERDLKAILMNGPRPGNNLVRPEMTPPQAQMHMSQASNAGLPGGKVTTVAELEANLKDIVLFNNNKLSQPPKQQMMHMGQPQPHPHPLQQQQQQQQQRSRQQEEDMAAFNKLLGMMKATGSLQDTPKMPRKHDGRPVSPINVTSAQKEAMSNQQKEILQKLLQQQQLQHQARLKQQQQQQQLQDQLLKFVKQNPTIITKPASPIPPQLAASLQPPPASPRCPSPAPGLGLQAPASPRAPSPIMFGSQPPMHLTAPSPIHPGQLQPPQTSPNLSVNTLQVGQGTPPGRSPLLARVPSPQELIVHTQAIMQNALIKKQLEDQKERFMKKQQERGKSPNPMNQTCPNLNVSQNSTSTPVSRVAVTPAFTPTSVIRKMANDKAEKEEKERSSGGHVNQDFADRGPVQALSKQEDFQQLAAAESATSQIHSNDGPRTPRPLFGQGTMQSSTPGSSAQTPTSVAQAAGQGRAIVKGGPPSNPVSRSGAAGAAGPTPPKSDPGHRPIIGAQGGIEGLMLEQQRQQALQQQQQRGAAVSAAGPTQSRPGGNVPYPVPGVSTPVSMPPRPGVPNISPGANAMLMQRMLHPGLSPSPNRGLQQVNSLSPLSQLSPLQLAALQAQAAQAQQQQQQQQRGGTGLDPRLPGAAAAAAAGSPARALFPPGGINPMVAAAAAANSPRATFQNNSLTAAAAFNAAISRALSPQPQIPQPMMSLAKHDVNGPLSPGGMARNNSASPNMGALLGGRQGMDTNLAKWFGSDVFKRHLPTMPPIPTQGQKVMTVDEIERRQQTVTH